jgi:hypothetical protein
MRLADKILVHQAHPAKIGADLTASVISNVLLWKAQPNAAIGPGRLIARARLLREPDDGGDFPEKTPQAFLLAGKPGGLSGDRRRR